MLSEIACFIRQTVPGGEVALIISAIVGGFAALGVLIAGVVNALVNARTASMRADQDNLRSTIETRQALNDKTNAGMQAQIDYLQSQLKAQTRENQTLHDADNVSRQENALLRGELETVRRDNQTQARKIDEQAVMIAEQSRQIVELQRENAELRAQNGYLTAAAAELRELVEQYKTGRKKQTGSLGGGQG